VEKCVPIVIKAALYLLRAILSCFFGLTLFHSSRSEGWYMCINTEGEPQGNYRDILKVAKQLRDCLSGYGF